MTPQEAQKWKEETLRSRHAWRIDPCHCSLDAMRAGQSNFLLIYKGGIDGHFCLIKSETGADEKGPKETGAVLEIGTYTGADPHIGEAAFVVQGRKRFSTGKEAFEFLVTKGGVSL